VLVTLPLVGADNEGHGFGVHVATDDHWPVVKHVVVEEPERL